MNANKRLYLFVSQYITTKTVKVVKAKTTILQGALACARARNLDFTFVKVIYQCIYNMNYADASGELARHTRHKLKYR